MGSDQSIVCVKKEADDKLAGVQDKSIVLMPTVHVPKDKLGEFKTYLEVIYKHKLDPKKQGLLYYGFTKSRTKDGLDIFSRQSFRDVAGALLHIQDIEGPMKAILEIATLVSYEVHAPADAIEQLKAPLEKYSPTYFTLHECSKIYVHVPADEESYGAAKPDSLLMIYHYYDIKEGKMDKMKDLFEMFFKHLDPKGEGCVFFGFTIDEESRVVLCREGYLNSDGYAKHLQNMEDTFAEIVEQEIADIKTLSAHGPALEVGKLRPLLDQMECTYFETMPGCLVWLEGS